MMESDEVRVVIRPTKVVALVCVLLAALLIVISLAMPYWLETDGIQESLWDCTKESCRSVTRKICQAAIITALVVTVVAFVLILYCLVSKKKSPKSKLCVSYLVAVFTAMICLLVALIIYPVMFINVEIKEYQQNENQREWNFSWSYGVCWGAWLFLFAAALLLLIDRKQNVSVQNEKRFYDTRL